MSACGPELSGRVLHPGSGRGEVVELDEPLSFWGGTNAAGEVIDAHHPQRGCRLAGKVVVMTSGRGSSSSSAVLAEQIRAGTAPAAIVLEEPDTIVVIGALVAAELYDVAIPVVQVSDEAALDSGVATVVADAAAPTARIRLEDR